MKTTFLALSVRLCRIGLVRFLLVFSSYWLVAASNAQPTTPVPATKSERELRALENLKVDIKGMLDEPKIKDAYLGVLILSVESGEVLFDLNSQKGFIPASNQKLLTSLVALTTLGPEFRYTTDLVTNGSVAGKTLKGDLIIRGSGDPTLGSPLMFPNYEPTFVFQQWADSLAKRGIEKIDGSVIADDNYFTADQYPQGWSHEDIPYGFAAPSSGICFAENSVSVSVSPNIRAGSRPFVAIIPETDYIDKTNLATTTKEEQDPIDITRLPGTSNVVIRGTIMPGSPATLEQISVEEPALYAATTFRNVLEQNGIAITGGTFSMDELREKVAYQKTRALASFVSPPLSEIIKVMNKRSNNLYAEQILRTIGKEVNGKGNWEEGIQLMEAKLLTSGIHTELLTINDGSGLSRMNLLSPSTLAAVLRVMAKQPDVLSKAFTESLPIMGVDGTLETRLAGTQAQGNVKAKTGSMTGVRSLSGYATTKDGETLAFVLVANNFSGASKEVNNVHDLILLRLVNFSRK